jgi:hypothetical protein
VLTALAGKTLPLRPAPRRRRPLAAPAAAVTPVPTATATAAPSPRPSAAKEKPAEHAPLGVATPELVVAKPAVNVAGLLVRDRAARAGYLTALAVRTWLPG